MNKLGTTKSLTAQAGAAHQRLPQLDGLRAVAVALVMMQHDLDFVPWGWVGVHLFFALSGFLITGILRRARGDQSFWGPFYLKRATRILPPLLPFFLFWMLMGAFDWKGTGWAYVFFGANIAQSVPGAKLTGMSVLWSLAVEEHFYLLWPFAIRWMRREALLVLLTAVLVLEPIARGLATPHVPSWHAIYFLTCFQLDGLAAGALMAILVESERARAWLLRYAGWMAAGGAVLFAACSRYGAFAREADSVLFNSVGYSLVALVSVFWVVHAYLRPEARVSRALAWGPVLFLGTISYGMYLYNGGCVDFVRLVIPNAARHHGIQGTVKLVLGIVLAVVFSWASFRFYESPIVRWGRRRAGEIAGPGHRGVDFMPREG